MILVVAEQKDGKLNRASWEAIAGAQQLAPIAGAPGVSVVVAGSNVNAVANELASAELSGVTKLEHEAALTYAEKDVVRRRNLYEQGAISLDEYQASQRDRDAAAARVSNAQAAIDSAEKSVKIAEDEKTVEFVTKGGETGTVIAPRRDEGMMDDLINHKVDIQAAPPSSVVIVLLSSA